MRPARVVACASALAACGTDPAAPSTAPESPKTDAAPPAAGPPWRDASVDDASASLDAAGEAEADAASPAPPDVYSFANGCYAVGDGAQRWLVASAGGASFALDAVGPAQAESFFLKASDLGTYLFYDRQRGYLVSDDGPLVRQTTLQSDVSLVDDSYVSGAEWMLEVASGARGPVGLRLHHRKTGQYLGAQGLTASPADALAITLDPRSDCTEHPELSVDATGQVTRTTFADGTLFGLTDIHSHILANFGFGGGGIFHGAPFHRLGVQHALSDCAPFHGAKGRKDFFGFGFDSNGGGAASMLPALLLGELPQDNHDTAGYPDFTSWPNAPKSSTHQVQYYRWLERAYLAGLRLVVLHAVSNEIICDLMVGQHYQKVRYGCDDMIAVDRQIEEATAMERYVDAQAGGPGRGFFRLVDSPARARDAIRSGKMAVILGIETANLFDCTSVPRSGRPACEEAYVKRTLDAYYARGVRAVFPVHKYDNAFSAGDGNRGFIEVGNFMNSGHWSDFVQDCPGITDGFDHGDVNFGGLNSPRDDYAAPPPVDMSGFASQPILSVAPYSLQLLQPPLTGAYCQKAGLTAMGETLLQEMMLRGMIVEVDHMNQRAYQRAYEILEANDYPPTGSHGRTYGGKLYALGGASDVSLGRCRDPNRRGATLDSLRAHLDQQRAAGAFEGESFGFDLNGFAGAAKARFGPESPCTTPQTDPITYPFTSYAGDVTLTTPVAGNRVIDFNSEGFVHIGLLPEMIEDARRDAASDADIEPLFRSAEAYVRMWERAEARGAALRATP